MGGYKMKEIYSFSEIGNFVIGNITEECQSVKFVIYANMAPLKDDRILFKGKIYKCTSVIDVTDDIEKKEGFSYSQAELQLEDEFVDMVIEQKTISQPLTFGELSRGDKFIDFPTDGDDNGHGGFRNGSYVFMKVNKKDAIRLCDANHSEFPETMQVYKIIF
jgi:hypothetical protein